MATVTVTVTVYDEDGFAVSGAAVTALDNSGASAGSGTTDASGVYTAGLSTSEAPPGEWTYWVTATGYLPAGGALTYVSALAAQAEVYLFPDPS